MFGHRSSMIYTAAPARDMLNRKVHVLHSLPKYTADLVVCPSCPGILRAIHWQHGNNMLQYSLNIELWSVHCTHLLGTWRHWRTSVFNLVQMKLYTNPIFPRELHVRKSVLLVNLVFLGLQ